MSGRILGALIVLTALAMGAGIYYMQVFYYYERVTLPPEQIVLSTPDGDNAAIAASGVEAIDAISSPIRFRACFETPDTPAALAERFVAYPEAEPLNAPFWFDCFDAAALGAALEEGRGAAFLGQKNIAHGVDRVIAVLDDGRGYIWHQVNAEIRK